MKRFKKEITVASYKDISELTGLSVGTISNVLRNKSNVKESNKEKVMEAIAKLDYRINLQASSLASSESGLLGLVISSSNNVAESTILQRMETFAEQQGSRLLWATSRDDREREVKNCETILSSKVDCLFVFLQSLENEEYFRHLDKTEKTPIIFLARHLDHCLLPFAAVDNYFAADKMADYIYEKGHREVVYLDVENNSMISPTRDRREGFLKRCDTLGIKCDVVYGSSKVDEYHVGYNYAEQMHKLGVMPKLVVMRDDILAVGFYSACTKYGIKVPEDVSILGFGKFYSDYITPKKLSTFDRDFNKVIENATGIYLEMKSDYVNMKTSGEIETHRFVKGELVEGETVLDINL